MLSLDAPTKKKRRYNDEEEEDENPLCEDRKCEEVRKRNNTVAARLTRKSKAGYISALESSVFELEDSTAKLRLTIAELQDEADRLRKRIRWSEREQETAIAEENRLKEQYRRLMQAVREHGIILLRA